MLWDLIATIVSGVGAAGIALLLRKLTAQRAPRYLVPVFAAAGMLSFQIFSEYQWFDHQKSLLPEGVVVVRAVAESTAWRPWSYLKPQVVRFMALDVKNATSNQHNKELMLATLYLFERRSPAVAIRQVIHCGLGYRADFTEQLPIPAVGTALDSHWHPIGTTEQGLLQVCKAQTAEKLAASD